jgi:hypothetical protein
VVPEVKPCPNVRGGLVCLDRKRCRIKGALAGHGFATRISYDACCLKYMIFFGNYRAAFRFLRGPPPTEPLAHVMADGIWMIAISTNCIKNKKKEPLAKLTLQG